MRRHRSRLAIGIASLCLAAQIYPLIHFLVVPHTRCEVHGDTIHASGHAPGHASGHAPGHAPGHEATPAAGRPARDSTSHAVRLDAGYPDEHEHEHCQLVTERREARCAPAAIAAGAPPSVADPVVLEHAAPSSLRPLYRLAPKISPPRAA